MKTDGLTKLALLLGLAMPAYAAPDDLPKTYALNRYEAMMAKSPFAVATAQAPPPQAPNFAKDLYIANAAKVTADESIVTLASSTDKNLKEYLSTKGPNKGGYSISNIEWSDRVGATKVTITKDGQFATLTFNQALLSQPVANAPAAQPAQPAVPNAPNPQVPPPVNTAGVPAGPYATPANPIKPAPIPTLPTPPPRVRGVIQRNPNPNQNPAAASQIPNNNVAPGGGQIVPDEQ